MNFEHFLNAKVWERIVERCNNFYTNIVLFDRLSLKEKELLKENLKYKGKYKGERCYILGNGPSINSIDFEMLKNELVITVNDMFRHEDFIKLKSDFHFIADPMYLKLNRKNPMDQETIEKICLLSTNGTVLFFPISGLDAVRKYNWNKKIHIQYFSSRLVFYDNYKEKIDFTRFIPCFQAVIHWCIAFAIYIGCSEIYLLGCDATNIVTDLSLFVNKEENLNYAYSLSKENEDYIRKRHMRMGLEYTLYGYWRIVHIFSELYRYCVRNHIKLYNCSQESILENIPKRDIFQIIN